MVEGTASRPRPYDFRRHGRVAGAVADSALAQRGWRPRGWRESRLAHENAVAMLKEDDHDRVLEMFDKFEHARREDQKQSLADRICADLTLHAQIAAFARRRRA